MNTNLEILQFGTLQEAQRQLDVNDPGYTAVLEGNTIKIVDPAGCVHATIDDKGVHTKTLL